MNSNSQFLFIVIGFLAAPVLNAQVNYLPNGARRPVVAIEATGGTIAGVAPKPGDGDYDPSQVMIETLIAATPGLTDIAELRANQIFKVISGYITEEQLLQIARTINTDLADPLVNGVVLTMGTDTIEEVAYFLQLVVNSPKPVVLVGAMRASNNLGADGPANLFNAVSLAANPYARDRGVMITMNDLILSANNAIKVVTGRPDALQAPDGGPLGSIHYGEVNWYRVLTGPHTFRTGFNLASIESLPPYEIIAQNIDAGSSAVEAAIQRGVKLIVLQGTGAGTIVQKTKELIESRIDPISGRDRDGVIFVLSSGVTSLSVPDDEDFPGTIGAQSLPPNKARFLGQLALTVTDDPQKIQEIFDAFAGPDPTGLGHASPLLTSSGAKLCIEGLE